MRYLILVLILCVSTATHADEYDDLIEESKQNIASLQIPYLCACDRRKVDTKGIGWLKQQKNRFKRWVDESYENDLVASMVKSYEETGGNIWERSQVVAGGFRSGLAIGKTNTYNRAIERKFTFYGFYMVGDYAIVVSPKLIMMGYHYRFGGRQALGFLENEIDSDL